MNPIFLIAVIAFLSVSTSPAAPLPKELRNLSDKETIVGIWQVENTSIDGKPLRGKKAKKLTIRFDDKGLRTVFDQGEALSTGNYSLDQSMVPHRITWRSVDGDELRCIYELNGDRLVLLFILSDVEIPKKLELSRNITIYTLARIKS